MSLNCEYIEEIPDRCTLEIYNISVVDAPLVRDYYWNYLNIPELNRRLLQNAYMENLINVISPIMKIPAMPVFSQSIQLVFHIYNHSKKKSVKFDIKRKKHCDCECVETAVSINKYKYKFHCPHRPMMKIIESEESIEPNGYGYIAIKISYDVPGVHYFQFDWEAFPNHIISLTFVMDVLEFDPLKCLITGALLPVEIDDYYSYQQPLWLYNQYGTDIMLKFCTDEKNVIIINPSVYLKKHCLQPLLVKFKPIVEGWCTLLISMIYKNIKHDIQIKAKGVKKDINAVQYSPLNDIPCPEAPYTIFPNSISQNIRVSECKTQMVVIANYSDNCVQCKWITNILPEYFQIKCSSDNFLCKPGYPVFCVISMTSFKQPCRFHHIPLTLEIHSHKIPPLNQEYEHLHAEMESIDDPKIFQPTLITKIFLNINLIINKNTILDFSKEHENYMNLAIPPYFNRNEMEAFFWKKMFKDEYVNILINNRKRRNYTYDELTKTGVEKKDFTVEKTAMRTIFRQLLIKIISDMYN